MNDIEDIKTILQPAESKYKEKGSLFIGKALHINDEDQAEEIIAGIRKKLFDATHHCYAYRLSSGAFKYSDDGEPSGTAGARILNAIDHFELKDCLCVVTRYFGGTKLGVGPLGKAYYAAAYDAFQSAQKINQRRYNELSIRFEFQLTSNVHRILSANESKILNSDYDEKARLICLAPTKNIESLIAELTKISKGKIEILVKDEFCYL